jgi:hypothetical protein
MATDQNVVFPPGRVYVERVGDWVQISVPMDDGSDETIILRMSPGEAVGLASKITDAAQDIPRARRTRLDGEWDE